MSEAQRGQRRGLHAAARGCQIQRRTQPHQVLRLRCDEGIDTVQRDVGGDAPGTEDIDEPAGLEERGAGFGVAGERLLRDDEHRLIRVAPDSWPQDGVQLGLVRVVGVGGGVVLGQHRDVVRAKAQPAQRACETRVLSTTTGAQSAEARSRNGGVGAVAVGSGVGDHGEHRQAELGRQRTAHEQNRAAAFAFEKAAAAAVVGAGDEALVDALRGHGGGLRRGVHIAKALQ